MTGRSRALTVVVPALDEADSLPALLADLDPFAADVVVVDGGSTDGTDAIARAAGARVVRSPRGRGIQLRAGAEASDGDWLLFLHADSRLDKVAVRSIVDFTRQRSDRDFGHFRFTLAGARRFYRFIETGQRIRQGLFGLVYGDQGMLVSRTLYDEVGGFPEWMLMEDVGLVDRLRRAGNRIVLDGELRTSPRRYEAEGGIRTWLRNTALIMAFRAGASPSGLERWYRPHPVLRRSGRGVIMFARAPVPGRVKTRLAASIGNAEAARIYRRLAEDTVSALRGGAWQLYVYVDPADDGPASLETVRHWLGTDGVEYRLQRGDDLGARMDAAFQECLSECSAVCLVGTDLPGMRRAWVEESFQRLDDSDLVLGPATDGGYYLMALTRPNGALFQGIAWSTPAVLEATMERAAAQGLQCGLLEPRTDVDTARDLPGDLLPHRSKARDLHQHLRGIPEL